MEKRTIIHRVIIERKEHFILALSNSTLSFEQFLSALQMLYNNNADLENCSDTSFLKACMNAARDNLLLDNKEATIVKKGSEALYLPMRKGIIKKLSQAGYNVVSCNVVYENDFFEYESGDNPRIIHKPNFKERTNPICVYIVVKTDSISYREVMTIQEINAIRDDATRGKNAIYSPWAKHFDEMAKKTVIHRLAKNMNLTAELDELIERDNQLYDYDNTQKTARGTNSALEAIENKEVINE